MKNDLWLWTFAICMGIVTTVSLSKWSQISRGVEEVEVYIAPEQPVSEKSVTGQPQAAQEKYRRVKISQAATAQSPVKKISVEEALVKTPISPEKKGAKTTTMLPFISSTPGEVPTQTKEVPIPGFITESQAAQTIVHAGEAPPPPLTITPPIIITPPPVPTLPPKPPPPSALPPPPSGHNKVYQAVGEANWENYVKPAYLKAITVETIKATGNPFPTVNDVAQWVSKNQSYAYQLMQAAAQPYYK